MEREELLALLSTYLDLQPTYRKDELKTLCPFHAETQPSCYINIEKMIYHCFGCGRAGTVTSMLRDLGVQLDSERAEAWMLQFLPFRIRNSGKSFSRC